MAHFSTQDSRKVFEFSCEAVDRELQLERLSVPSDQAQAKAADCKSRSLLTHHILWMLCGSGGRHGPCVRSGGLQQAVHGDKGKTTIHGAVKC